MRKWAAVAANIPARRLDLDDQGAVLCQQFAAKRASDLLGELKDADTGEREVVCAHGEASRAANEKFVETSRTAKKVLSSLHPASDRLGTWQI
jgi:aminoglycoside phosphotransferase (APT) family kinase protein